MIPKACEREAPEVRRLQPNFETEARAMRAVPPVGGRDDPADAGEGGLTTLLNSSEKETDGLPAEIIGIAAGDR